MYSRKVRSVFITVTFFFIVVVLGFTGELNITAFKKTYTNSILSSYTVVGGQTVRKIEYAVKYGKQLTNFYGMESLLAEVKQGSPNIEEVFVVLPGGTVVYSLSSAGTDNNLPREITGQVSFNRQGSSQSYKSILYAGKYHTFIPIRDRQNHWIGSLDITFNEAVINARSDQYMQQIFVYLLFMVVIAVIFLALILYKVPVLDEWGKIRRKAILTVVIAVLGVTQIVYGIVNFATFQQIYLDVSKENTSLTAKIIHKDIQSIIDKGLNYSDLYQTKGWMKRIVQYVPEIENIYLVTSETEKDRQEAVLQKANTDPGYVYSLPLMKDHNGSQGSVNVVISKSFINGKLLDMALDSLVVLVVAFLAMSELSILVVYLLGRKAGGDAYPSPASETTEGSERTRISAFIFSLAVSMSFAFMPLYALSLYHPLLNIPKAMAAGLPVSTQLLGIGIAVLAARPIIDSLGCRNAFLVGLPVLAAGLAFSGAAWSLVALIVAGGVTGFGTGICLLALQGENSKAFSLFNGGSSVGICCGSVVGALLADRMGFGWVFPIAVLIAAAAGVFVLVSKEEASVQETASEFPSVGGLADYYANGNLLVFTLLVIVPMGLYETFFTYLLPLFAVSKGFSLPAVGRVLLICGLFSIFLSPWLDKRIKGQDVRKAIARAGIIIAAGFAVFAVQGRVPGILGAALVIGVGKSLWQTARCRYFADHSDEQMHVLTEPPKNVGNDDDQTAKIDFTEILRSHAIDYLNVLTVFGGAVGPLVFALALIPGPSVGMGITGAVAIVLTALFVLYSKADEELPVSQSINS